MPEPETAAPVSAEPSPAPRPVPGPPTLEVSGRVATITLRRPDRANVLQPEDLAALDDHVQAVDAMPEVLALVLRAEGRLERIQSRCVAASTSTPRQPKHASKWSVLLSFQPS